MNGMILLKAYWKKQKRNLLALCVLLSLCAYSVTAAITMQTAYAKTQTEGMERLGYGTLTAWITGTDTAALVDEIETLSVIDRVESQSLIYSAYSINGGHSDSEGELLAWEPALSTYRFLDEDCTDYVQISGITDGEVYLSPAMRSLYNAEVGNTIYFELSRENEGVSFRVAGFFEDSFMGSAMIDRKSFLISSSDYDRLVQTLENTTQFNRLGSRGAMLHIFAKKDTEISVTKLNQMCHEQTTLGNYIQTIDSYDTIYGYMLLLPNILTGFLAAFALLLLVVLLIVLANTINNTMEADESDFAILKTIGCSAKLLRAVMMAQYAIPLCVAMIVGCIMALATTRFIGNLAVTSTGILLMSYTPFGRLALVLTGMLAVLFGMLYAATRKVLTIRPIQAIQKRKKNRFHGKSRLGIRPRMLMLSLAFRAVVSSQKQYLGIVAITMILTVFMVVVGKMSAWVGTDGEGLMNAFSVAEHDIGIDPTINDFDYDEAEALIERYSPITDTYRIAMLDGSVNGVDETINVLDEPQWFHLLEGTLPDADGLLITEYVAADLDLQIGDEVSVSYQSATASYIISGIYECANGMGTNVGMNIDGFMRLANTDGVSWCTHYLLEDNTNRAEILDELQARYRLVADIHDNSWSGLNGIVTVLHLVIALMYALTLLVIDMVTALSARRAFAAEQEDIAILRSIGVQVSALRISFGLRYLLMAGLGAIIGMLLAMICADNIVAVILAQFGVGGFHVGGRLSVYATEVVFVTLLAFFFAWINARAVKKVSVTELMKGE